MFKIYLYLGKKISLHYFPILKKWSLIWTFFILSDPGEISKGGGVLFLFLTFFSLFFFAVTVSVYTRGTLGSSPLLGQRIIMYRVTRLRPSALCTRHFTMNLSSTHILGQPWVDPRNRFSDTSPSVPSGGVSPRHTIDNTIIYHSMCIYSTSWYATWTNYTFIRFQIIILDTF